MKLLTGFVTGVALSVFFLLELIMKNYRVRVETYDGLVTIWYEKSKAIRACDLICNRVYNQLCGLNVKEIEVTPSV